MPSVRRPARSVHIDVEVTHVSRDPNHPPELAGGPDPDDVAPADRGRGTRGLRVSSTHDP